MSTVAIGVESTPTQTQSQKRFLDIPSAARYIGFSIRHMRRLAEIDHIPIMQIGRKHFIQTKDLDLWKARRAQNPN